MVGNVQGISSGIHKTDKPTVISCLDSSSIQNSFLISLTNADSGITKTLAFSTKYSFRYMVQTGINKVDQKFKIVKRKLPYTITIADDNTSRCIIDRVGEFV